MTLTVAARMAIWGREANVIHLHRCRHTNAIPHAIRQGVDFYTSATARREPRQITFLTSFVKSISEIGVMACFEVRHVVTVWTAFFSTLAICAADFQVVLFGDEKRLEFSLISNGVFQALLQSQAAFQPGFRHLDLRFDSLPLLLF